MTTDLCLDGGNVEYFNSAYVSTLSFFPIDDVFIILDLFNLNSAL
jgi:hypothetical protein